MEGEGEEGKRVKEEKEWEGNEMDGPIFKHATDRNPTVNECI